MNLRKNTRHTKNIIFALLPVFFFVLVPHVLADGFVPLAPIPGLTDYSPSGSVIDSSTLATFFNNLYKYLIGLAATLAVIEIIWGGLLYSTTDSVGNKEQGKEKIRMAIFGLILVLSPVLVFSIINPSILNLSLNLPEIKTLSTPQPQQLPDCVGTNTVNCKLTPKNESGTTGTLPTCGPDVVGSCTTSGPACTSGQYCYTTTDKDHIPGVICSAKQSDCEYLYNQQSNGNNGGVSVTSSCALCP